MALDQSALLELVEMMRSADGGELMRRLLGTMLQALVDAEATAHIGAGPHERTDARTTQRNGTRDKTVTTTAGDLTVKIPKVRTGSFFPALLAPRRRIDVALHAVVMQAYVEGVSTRRVDDLVVALGGTGISKSEVSRICAQLDTDVAAWRSRPLDEIAFPYVFLRRDLLQGRGSTSGSCPRPSSSPPACPLTAAVRCSAARSGTARPRRSGPSSCARCATAAWTGCSWSSATATAA